MKDEDLRCCNNNVLNIVSMKIPHFLSTNEPESTVPFFFWAAKPFGAEDSALDFYSELVHSGHLSTFPK